MEEGYKDDDILSLSDLQMVEEDTTTTTGSQEVNTTFYQDFFGVSIEDQWSRKNSNKSSPVKKDDNGRKPPAAKMEETNPMFRSSSGSFRYMRFKVGSRTGSWRSKSVSVMASASRSKSRWQVFTSGFGSGKSFLMTKMDLIDIKTRQLRSQSTTKEDSGGRRITGKKVWWRLVDVLLGCGGGGGYDRNNMLVV